MLIFGHRNIDPAMLGLSIKDYCSGDASFTRETKTAAPTTGANGTHTSTATPAAETV